MAIGTFTIAAILLASLGQVSGIGNAKSEARVAFDRLIDALSLCDRQEVARLTSPDWTQIRLDGRVYTREESLKDMRAVCKPGPPPVLSDVQVRTFRDDTAIITAAAEPREKGHTAAGPIRMTIVWIKQNGRWVSVHAHTSQIQTKAADSR
jgi:uncharacterized protein (TIGR02246 family)